MRGRRHFGQLSLRWRVFLSQLPLTASVLVVTVLCLMMGRQDVVTSPHFLTGLAGIAALTVLAGVVPWHRLPRVSYWTIPLLDFLAIAPLWTLARQVLDGMTILAAFPVFWLAWSGLYPVLAVALGAVGSALVAWWPYLVAVDSLPEGQLLRPLVVPLFMLALGITASVLTRSLDRQREEVQQVLAHTRKQNRLLRTVMDTVDVGIVVTDRDGNDLIMNAAQRRTHLLALPPGADDAAEHELLLFEQDGQTQIPLEDRPVRRAVQGEGFSGRVITIGAGAGRQRLAVAAQPMRDDSGAFDGAVVAFHNVTDLVEAVHAREQFVADVSHEFRTPLTSIIGYLELALDAERERDPDSDPVIASHLRTIHRNAERLLALVNSLLDSAASSTSVMAERTDLMPLIRHSVESAAVRAEHDGVTLSWQGPTALPVEADPVKISQVLDNLVSNGIKFTPDGGAVTVVARQDEEYAEIRVQDTGMGMSPEELEKTFRHFYRTEHVRRAAIPGTGLGLAITQGFVRAHGGEITVASAPGEGTEFTVRIPLECRGAGATG